jgi:hypothetical protein
VAHIISRGSRDGMLSRIYSPWLPTQCGCGEATDCGV